MALSRNEGPVDRTVRTAVGVGLVGIGLAFFPLTHHLAFLAALGVGAVLIATGVSGVCPLYKIVGMDTGAGHGRAVPPQT